ncbi:SDR family oxidoreductase [Mycobacterium sp. BMJ-28]
MKVLMVGATGLHGGLVLAALARRGVTVRALARTEQRAALARDNGADEVVIGDLADESSLRAAVVGVDGVFHLGPAFVPGEADMGLSLIRVARAAGVRKFVFSGVIHPEISALTNHASKLPVQEALCESGMEFTILQPARFMQNLRWSIPEIRTECRITVPYSVYAKMCWVDYRDVAEVVATAMTGDDLARGTFELCAPGVFDSDETAEIVSAVVGRRVVAEQIPREAYAAQIYDGPMRDGMLRMLTYYDRHGLSGGNGLVLKAILGREPRTLADYFRENLG